MVKKKNFKKELPKPPPKIKYEDTKRFKAFDWMMRTNKGIRLE